MKAITILIALIISATNFAQNLEWSQTFGSDQTDYATDIHVDSDNNVIVTGSFSGSIDFDPGIDTFLLTAQTGQDLFVRKLDSDGNFLWAVAYGGSSTDNGNSIVTDAQNNVYVTGKLHDNIVIFKFDINGNLLWYKLIGGGGINEGKSLDIDPITGNLILVAEFQNTIYLNVNGANNIPFDQTAGSSQNAKDIVVIRMQPSGYVEWVRTYGGTDVQRVWGGCHVDGSGNIFVIGTFAGTCDFDPSANNFDLTSNGNSDVFIQKLDSTGNHIWTKQIGGNQEETTNGSDLKNGSIYITGSFRSTVDFDPNAGIQNEVASGSDIFILKMDTSGNLNWVNTYGGGSNDQGANIKLDDFGNIYGYGLFRSNVDFGPVNVASVGNADLYVLKLDTMGVFQNLWHMGGTLYDGPGGITVGQSGEIYGIGGFEDNIDFDLSNVGGEHISEGAFDAFTFKLNEFLDVPTVAEMETVYLYPNPTSHILSIESDVDIESISIIDMMGNTVFETKENSFSVSNFASGVYMVQITTLYGITTTRFTKE